MTFIERTRNHWEHRAHGELKDCTEELIIVADCLLLELKCIDSVSPIELARVINYLKLLHFKRGYILNFKRRLLKEGIRRVSI